MSRGEVCFDHDGRIAAPMPRLVVSDAEVGYNSMRVLQNVTFSVHATEVVGLIGTNGSGKSTLLKAIVGHCATLKGSFAVSGRTLPAGLSTDQICRTFRIAYLPQDRRTVENLTVEENIELAAWERRNRRRRRAMVETILSAETFRALRGLEHRRADVLSGGQRLILSLAMLTAREADLYLLDEPSSGADVEFSRVAEVIIRQWADSGAGVLLVEQRLPFLLRVANRAARTCPIDYSNSADSIRSANEIHTISAVSEKEYLMLKSAEGIASIVVRE